ncbi:MAG TPA: lipopolysaccharide biosynthesis protein, partial [Iamia sp.]
AVGPVVLPALFQVPDSVRSAASAAVAIYAVQVVMDLVGGSCQASLEGFQRVDVARALDGVRRTLVAGSACVAAVLTDDLVPTVAAAAGAAAVGALVAGGVLARVARGVTIRPRRPVVRALLVDARSMALLRPLGVLHRTMDRVIVGIVLGPQAVAVVEVATQLQNGTDAVLSATSYSVVPASARLHSRGDDETLSDLLGTGTRYVLLATWSVAALSAALAAPAIRLWVGDRYDEASGLVVLGVIGLAVLATAQVGSNVLLGIGRAGSIARVFVVTLAVNAAVSTALVHVIGIAGAFVGTLAAAVIQAPALLAVVRREVPFPPRDLLTGSLLPGVPVAGATAAAALAVVALPLGDLPTLVGGGLAGGLAAGATVLAFGLRPGEARRLRDSLVRGG